MHSLLPKKEELNFFPLFQCQHQSYEHAIKKMHYYCYPEQNGPKAKQAFRTVQQGIQTPIWNGTTYTKSFEIL
jgi:hypothetical protein